MTSRPRILVAGAGSIGERHVRCFLKTNECDVSACDMDAAKRDKLVAKYAKKYAELKAIANDATRLAALVSGGVFEGIGIAASADRRDDSTGFQGGDLLWQRGQLLILLEGQLARPLLHRPGLLRGADPSQPRDRPKPG